MKTAEPKIIYLQIGDDTDISEFKESDFQTNAISWCWERIFPNDIEYVSKQSIIGIIDEMIKEIQSFDQTDATKDYRSKQWNADITCMTLVELKQKIEEL